MNALFVDQTDAIILAACRPEDGAIEDCEVEPLEVRYFFQSGAMGTVDRISGQVTMRAAA